MQYLLTQEEFDGFRRDKQRRDQDERNELQKLCTMAAQHVPVPRPWSPGSAPAPWGCILEGDRDPGYCDDCPAQKLCPHPAKHYSK